MVTELMVRNVDQSIAFYQRYLKCEISNKLIVENQIRWAEVQTPKGSRLQFYGIVDFINEIGEFRGEEPRASIVLIFEVDEIENTWNEVKDKIVIVDPLKTKDYGAIEFKFKDPDGYIIQLTQRIN
ncbi:MAG: VOC family protein [Candidatus Shapirobacteria bacterium]